MNHVEDFPNKPALRQRMRAQLKTLAGPAGQAANVAARELLRRQKVWAEARSVLFFAALPGEIDLLPVAKERLGAGGLVALPRFSAQSESYEACRIENIEADCVPGQFGILEPAACCASVPLNKLDLVLVPGLAFDFPGHRLGRGRGFYDRLLAHFRGIKCGVASDGQVLDCIPHEPHDVRMNYILTPTRWIEIAE